MPRPLTYTLLAAGIVAMVASSLWAPPQPELWQDGAACEIAPCGTLEDPARWRAAWWLWTAGLCIHLVAIPIASRARRVRPLWVVVVVILAPAWLFGYAVIAYLVSLSTSVHGAATVFACGVLAPFMAMLAGALKSGISRQLPQPTSSRMNTTARRYSRRNDVGINRALPSGRKVAAGAVLVARSGSGYHAPRFCNALPTEMSVVPERVGT